MREVGRPVETTSKGERVIEEGCAGAQVILKGSGGAKQTERENVWRWWSNWRVSILNAFDGQGWRASGSIWTVGLRTPSGETAETTNTAGDRRRINGRRDAGPVLRRMEERTTDSVEDRAERRQENEEKEEGQKEGGRKACRDQGRPWLLEEVLGFTTVTGR